MEKLVTRLCLFSMSTLVFCLAPQLSATVQEKKIVFVGDSLTAGYGIDQENAFPALVGEFLKKRGFRVSVTNGGVSGSTTANASSRVKWFLKLKPDLFIIALGANDGLRGLSVKSSRKELAKAIELAKGSGAQVIIAGMKMPPNYGADYRKSFEDIFPSLAKQFSLPLIPFLLEGVAGEKELNLADGIHPNQKGHQVISKTVYPYIEKFLKKAKPQKKSSGKSKAF